MIALQNKMLTRKPQAIKKFYNFQERGNYM